MDKVASQSFPLGGIGRGLIGGLAQLARALDLHSRGHRFDSDILHEKPLPASPKERRKRGSKRIKS
jgi:hypothetical protein